MKREIALLTGLLIVALTTYAQNNLNEGFENTIFPPEGWYSYPANETIGTTTFKYVDRDTDEPHSGNASAALYAETYDGEAAFWLITPQLYVNSGEDSVVFYMNTYDLYEIGTDNYLRFDLLVSTANNEFESFTDTLYSEDFTDATTNEYIRYAFSLEEFTGETIYIAFRVKGSESFVYYLIDDVSGPQIYTAECIPTSVVTVKQITDESAVVYWNDVDADNYTLQIAESSSEGWDAAVEYNNITDTTFELTNLNPATAYKVRVSGNCSSANSQWSNSFKFATFSNETVTLPYNQTFEEDESFGEWSFFSDHSNNEWYIGNAAGYGTESEKHSLYITSDNGISNNYSNGNTRAYAAIRVEFPQEYDEFTLSYKYRVKGNGQSWGQWDYLTVYMIEDSQDVDLDNIPSYATTVQGKTYNKEYWEENGITLNGSYAGTTQKIIFMWHSDESGTYPPAAAIDNIIIKANDCAAPYNLQASEISEDNAIVHWSGSDYTSVYLLYYKKAAQSDYDSVEVYDTIYDFENTLDHSSVYTMFVKAGCGEDFSESSNIITVNTDCGNITALPYSEEFEGYGTNDSEAFPVCWYRAEKEEGFYDYPSIFTNGASTTGNFLMMMASYGTKNVFCTNKLDEQIDINKVKVSFLYESSKVGMPFVVGVMSNPQDASTFTVVDSVKAVSSLTWEQKEVSFENYNGTGRYIAFWLGYPYTTESYPSAFMDNVTIDFAVSDEPCSVKPNKLKAENITQNNAYLTWNENTPAASWYVFYKKASDNDFDSIYVTDEPLLDFENNLEENTIYNVFVKTDCGNDNTASSDTVSFKTTCNDIESLPYIENFNSYDVNTFPSCWYSPSQYTSTYYGTYPVIEFDSHTNDNCLSFLTSGNNKIAATLHKLSEDIDITEIKADFKYFSSVANQPLVVGIMTDPYDISTFTAIDTITSSTITNFEQKEVVFSNYNGEGRYITFFFGESNSSTWTQTGKIDDLVIDYIDDDGLCLLAPSGITVNNISQTDAEISWNEGNASQWYIYYKQSQSNTYDSVLTEENTYSFDNNLNTATSYTVYVRSVCDDGTMSLASNTLTFTTECAAITSLPFSEDFDNTEMYQIPDCWSRIGYDFLQGLIYPGILVNGYAQSNWLAFVGSDGSEKMIVSMPELDSDLGDISSMSVDFKYIDYYGSQIVVGVMTDPQDANTFVAVDTVTSSVNWDDVTVCFDSYTGEGRYISFYAGYPYNGGDDVFVGIDNVKVYYTETPQDSCQNTDTAINQTINDGGTFVFNNISYSQEGTYYDTVAKGDGCYTYYTITINVIYDTVIPCENTDTTIYASINEGEIYDDNGFKESVQGTYTQQLTTYDGCDSVVTLVLTVNSSVYDISYSGNITLYPNPAVDNVTIEGLDGNTTHQIDIYNEKGENIHSEKSRNSTELTLNISQLPTGMYHLIISNGKFRVYKKLIVK